MLDKISIINNDIFDAPNKNIKKKYINLLLFLNYYDEDKMLWNKINKYYTNLKDNS